MLQALQGPGGRELVDALVLAAYAVGVGYAVVLWIAYRLHQRRRAAEARLRRVYAAYESSLQGALIATARGAIEETNAAFERITGYRRDEVVGRHVAFLVSGRHDGGFAERLLAAAAREGAWQGEVWIARRDGELVPVHMTVSAVRDARGEHAHTAASFVDITERKLAEERIRHLALHDILTDLPNRSLLRSRTLAAMANARRDGGRVALLFLDLDRFKNVNDTLGHGAGDQLLRECAVRLLEALRPTDLVARQGGDEFVVLLPEVHDAAQCAQVAETLRAAVQRPFSVGSRELRLTCSLGIALFPECGQDFDTLLRNADTALYAAKTEGRDRVRFYTRELSQRASERLMLEGELRRALAAGAISLAYQPQHELATRRLAGLEALARWTHARRGAISPGVFVPIAEEAGLAPALGQHVLEHACRQRAAWLAAGLTAVPVAVNVSATQLRDDDFAERVAAVLATSGLPPQLLELEVTESVVIAGLEAARARLERLARLGVRLAIDDFGTGYSSLAYLKRLPVHKLKIDRSFVADLPEAADSRAIAAAVVGLARGLGLRTIAEGVESERQAEFLQACGCDEAQGLLFGAPLAPAQFAARHLPPQRTISGSSSRTGH